ncbi:hypothetical protein QBD01_003709 [Ochrobactrum sp. 19YEA23]|nr:hypothetical protein [Ochrobactrum sp. 19YEA23]
MSKIYCSFCGKDQDEVPMMIAGPAHVAICHGCIFVCLQAVADWSKSILLPEMDRATEGSFETGSAAAENAREVSRQRPDDGSVSHAGAGESPATVSISSVSPQAPPQAADEKNLATFDKRGEVLPHEQK